LSIQKNKIAIHHPIKDGQDFILIEFREGGSRSWRNNNPGNLRSSNFARKKQSIGSAGGFAVFESYEKGFEASLALLKTSTYIDLTIAEAIARRSPSNENDTARVQELIAYFSGLNCNRKIKDLYKFELESLNIAIQKVEGWKVGLVTFQKESHANN